MEFKLDHFSINVLDLDKSIKFYEEAVGLKVIKRVEAPDGSFILVYMGQPETNFTFELTWLRDRTEKYDMGENEYHLAFRTHDIEAAHAKHEKMNCICFDNIELGVYFILDPDGLWVEIAPFRD